MSATYALSNANTAPTAWSGDAGCPITSTQDKGPRSAVNRWRSPGGRLSSDRMKVRRTSTPSRVTEVDARSEAPFIGNNHLAPANVTGCRDTARPIASPTSGAAPINSASNTVLLPHPFRPVSTVSGRSPSSEPDWMPRSDEISMEVITGAFPPPRACAPAARWVPRPGPGRTATGLKERAVRAAAEPSGARRRAAPGGPGS